jgi:uncharacterized membrane protein
MRAMNPQPEAASPARLVFSARLHPNQSLSRRGRIVVLVGAGLAGLFISIPLYVLGAWPVIGFYGLDVLGLYVAFRVCSARALEYEELILTEVELLFRKVSHKGANREWRFNAFWVRLQRDEHKELGVRRLALVEGRRSVVFGSFLGAEEKAEVAGALQSALGEARRY